jgi:tetratricopeptide (TPR) repeat protein
LNSQCGIGQSLHQLGIIAELKDQLAMAQTYYEQALAIHETLDQPQLVAENRAGLARVSLFQNKLGEAQAHLEEVLDYRQSFPTFDGTNHRFRVFLTCYRVLAAAQAPEAKAVLREAHALLQDQCDTIADDQRRASFLSNVPLHREVIALFKALNG